MVGSSLGILGGVTPLIGMFHRQGEGMPKMRDTQRALGFSNLYVCRKGLRNVAVGYLYSRGQVRLI
jgi:hypothetical protein